MCSSSVERVQQGCISHAFFGSDVAPPLNAAKGSPLWSPGLWPTYFRDRGGFWRQIEDFVTSRLAGIAHKRRACRRRGSMRAADRSGPPARRGFSYWASTRRSKENVSHTSSPKTIKPPSTAAIYAQNFTIAPTKIKKTNVAPKPALPRRWSLMAAGRRTGRAACWRRRGRSAASCQPCDQCSATARCTAAVLAVPVTLEPAAGFGDGRRRGDNRAERECGRSSGSECAIHVFVLSQTGRHVAVAILHRRADTPGRDDWPIHRLIIGID